MTLRVGCRADDADKHEFDVNSLLYHKGKLYSAGDDGRIKVWASDLTKLGEVQAHPCSVYSITASDDSLYSCSNEGTVKSFDLTTLKEKEVLAQDDKNEFWKVCYSNGALYAGDNTGNIIVWKDNKTYGTLNVAEPVKDMAVSGNFLFSVKDTDLVITDVHLGGEKIQFGTKKTYVGRAPIALIGKQLFAFASREGKDIIVNENNDQSHFKPVSKVEGAHEMIINTLAGTTWNNKNVLFSGGWDKTVKKWNIDDDIIKQDGSCDVEIVINSIAIGDKGEVYVGGGDGHIVRIEIE
ncbi:myosin heavy chain kinase D [Anoplophora glabripennis]|uniref:Myosin heavy chain kinase B n=1 Tax=Anoplophora glabripennis TaxID=217634 RepID=V5G1V2_ANOGL|nr:myosin heavy chain kinase D [Anoplophora glabripennis]